MKYLLLATIPAIAAALPLANIQINTVASHNLGQRALAPDNPQKPTDQQQHVVKGFEVDSRPLQVDVTVAIRPEVVEYSVQSEIERSTYATPPRLTGRVFADPLRKSWRSGVR